MVLDADENIPEAMAVQCVMAIVGVDTDGRKWITHKKSEDLRSWEMAGLIADLGNTLQAIEVMRLFEDDD